MKWSEMLHGQRILIRDATGKDYAGKVIYQDSEQVVLEDGGGIRIWINRRAIVSVAGPLK